MLVLVAWVAAVIVALLIVALVGFELLGKFRRLDRATREATAALDGRLQLLMPPSGRHSDSHRRGAWARRRIGR